ncbi:hypothetical protein QTI17_23735 [Variovorax sp. J31P179]|jgi:hypothetical protein|uniref:hypothetical protein n=1 Tax=Variovorax sp. J31P179 TaxID=3053508 RepID=UPI002575F1E0|nr:hypothetical protein [Variovorax sp. J31P179]MDM0083614.1 hypothetical protein [Variovorax sp. J31P179]
MFKRRTCMQTPARRNVRGDEMGSNSRETRAMRIVRIPSNKVEGPISDYHVLTYADSGFGPLPHYTRRRVPRDQVEAIVSRINQRDEAATFFPLPLSAVPRKVIWDKRHWAELRAHLADFFHVNARTFGARRILVDLQSPHGTAHLMEPLRGAVEDVPPVCVDEIVVVTAAEGDDDQPALSRRQRDASVIAAIVKDHEAAEAERRNRRSRP